MRSRLFAGFGGTDASESGSAAPDPARLGSIGLGMNLSRLWIEAGSRVCDRVANVLPSLPKRHSELTRVQLIRV